jgi:hypothetical protein
MSKTQGLSPRQAAAADLLAIGEAISEVAKKTKTPVRTLFDWRKLPEFQAAIRERRSAIFDALVGRLVDRALDGARVLHEIAIDGEVSTGVRVSASRVLVDAGLRAFEEGELAARLEALEHKSEQ